MSRRLLVLLTAGFTLAGCDALLSSPLPMGRIRIEARGRQGEPLPGIIAELYVGYRAMGYLETDARGRVDYTDVPEGSYGVFMRLPEAYVGWDEVTGRPRNDRVSGIPVTAGSDTVLRFEFLRRGPGSIRVVSVDPQGRRIAGNLITLYSPTKEVATGPTDTVGVVVFDSVPMGLYGVRSNIPVELRRPGGPSFVWADGLLIDQGHTAEVQLVSPWCAGQLTVRVVDGDGTAVRDATVALYTGPTVFRSERTDGTGQLLWRGIRCGNYGVALTPPAGYRSPWARDTAYVDGLQITETNALTATLRALRIP